MSISFYTGQEDGGAVSQFYLRLQQGHGSDPDVGPVWQLDDRTRDGFTIADIDFHGEADLITMTVGGNDLLQNMDREPAEFIPRFSWNYSRLLKRIKQAHPNTIVVVGNIYQPAGLSAKFCESLARANTSIDAWARTFGFRLADIHEAFLGHEEDYLCLGIEPTLAGATVIADLFERAAEQHP